MPGMKYSVSLNSRLQSRLVVGTCRNWSSSNSRAAEELAAARGWSGRARRQRSQKKAVLLNQMTLPEKFGWAHLSSLTRAAELDQGACGSCWATATAKVLNAHAEIYNSSQTSFSIQDLVDCVPNPARCGGTGGCQGSTTELAMQYVMEYGIHTEAEKSYVGQDQECSASLTDQDKMSFSDEAIRREGIHNASSAAPGLSIGLLAFEVLPMNQYQPLLLALYEKGPVAVSVDASMWSLYSTGIFNSCEKDAVINHAVTLIGWGAQSDKKYWTIQNSWGSAWGENGLVRLLRHDNDDWCGTDYYPLDGTGCEGGASEVAVCGMCGVHSDSVIPHFAKRAE